MTRCCRTAAAVLPCRLSPLAFLWTAFALALIMPPRTVYAAPPVDIDLRTALGRNLVMGRWQPVLVTLTNPDGGEALEGEAQITLEDPRTGMSYGTFGRAVRLPRGAGSVQTTVHVLMPDNAQPEVVGQVARTRDGSRVGLKRFNKIAILPEQLTLLAVTNQPGSLDYLSGERVGVIRENGALRPGAAYPPSFQTTKNIRGVAANGLKYEMPVKVEYAVPGLLPDRALGYDAVSIVYLGDIAPDVFSDAQTEALRRWVASGGLLVLGGIGKRLSADERFHGWIPSTPLQGIAVTQEHNGTFAFWQHNGIRHGRGNIISLGKAGRVEATGTDLPPDILTLWRAVGASGITPLPVGNALARNDGRIYPALSNIVQRAPGLKAPSSVGVGLFLGVYLLLLVPVNYLILKRMDRREWTWATVPALVLVFSLGAYGFGFAAKGTDMLQNVAAIVEMGPGSGDASVTGAVGIFSPRRAHYDIETTQPDTLLYAPEHNAIYNREYAPLTVSEATGNGGAIAKDAAISMWAMRSFGVRGNVTMGNGCEITLTRRNGQVTGTVTNRTDRTLENASLMVRGGNQFLGTLRKGESRMIAIPVSGESKASAWGALFSGSPGSVYGSQAGAADAEMSREMANGLALAVGQFLNQSSATGGESPNDALLTAWSKERLLPIRVNGAQDASNSNMNLILVHARVEGR